MRYILSVALILFIQISVFAQKQKVIFDCDLGGDIDDAFALALLLTSQEEFDILGITLDHGNTTGRAELACKILYETGLGHIPVYAGDHTPTVVGEQTELEGFSTQMMWSKGFDKLKPRKEHAVDFIMTSLNAYPDEIVLVTVGPVDNIAGVLDKDPDILKKAKKVVSMFGSIEVGYGGGQPVAEWNVRGSIEAGKRLMESGANISLAPLDITDHVIMKDEYLMAIAMRNTPLTNAISSLYALWYRHADWAVTPKMFDGVAIGMVLWPELFTTREAHVYVDDKGFTRIDENKAPNCSIGVSIKDQVFLDRMLVRILQQNYTKQQKQ